MNIDPILRLPAVMRLTGQARTTIYEKLRRGEFPKPVKLGQRAVGWYESDIAKWLEALKGEPKNE
jgi:prophage regulatory protein